MSVASDRLQLYLDAEAKVLNRQSVRFEEGGINRQLTFANLNEIREGIAYWQSMVNAENKAASGKRSPFNCWYADFS
jgi:hypothetical protein